MSRSHVLKCHARSFDAIWRGLKLFEFRRNDRTFEVGDRLTLEEMESDSVADMRTGRRIYAEVSYILRGPDFGVPVGFCVMSLDPKTLGTTS